MRTKLPDCPKCQEFDLYVRQEGDVLIIRCAECGWTTGRITLATGQDAGEVVAATVEAAKQVSG
jgi:Zn ribbon nucleic-acid-binding protein